MPFSGLEERINTQGMYGYKKDFINKLHFQCEFECHLKGWAHSPTKQLKFVLVIAFWSNKM